MFLASNWKFEQKSYIKIHTLLGIGPKDIPIHLEIVYGMLVSHILLWGNEPSGFVNGGRHWKMRNESAYHCCGVRYGCRDLNANCSLLTYRWAESKQNLFEVDLHSLTKEQNDRWVTYATFLFLDVVHWYLYIRLSAKSANHRLRSTDVTCLPLWVILINISN